MPLLSFLPKNNFFKIVLILAAGLVLGLILNPKPTNQPAQNSGGDSFQYTASVAQRALEEIKSGQAINGQDSDGDGLTDSEEIIFGSDPKNKDSDGDEYLDGQEVNNGYNPAKKSPGDKVLAMPKDTELDISSATGKEAIAAYFEKTKTPSTLKGSIVYQSAINDAKEGNFQKLDQVIQSLKISQEYLQNMSVPAETKEIHKIAVGLMPPLIEIFNDFKNAKKDPNAPLEALKKVQSLLPFVKHLQNKMDELAAKYNLSIPE